MKINIIGAGVAGLSAGCYLQMNGFETEIFEKHSRPGGLCTGWKRGEYTFDGCIHWLLGSNPSNPFYLLWSELIDLSSIEFMHHDVRMDIEVKDTVDRHGSNVFHLYTNLEKLSGYLLDLAPEDAASIKKLIRSMRKMQGYEIPPMIRSVPELLPFWEKLKFIKHLPLLFFMMRWKNQTNFTFARKLKNPFLREAFQLLFDGDEMPLLIVTLPLAFNDKLGVGYPVGGSLDFVGKIEDRYLALGGRVRYNTTVEEIVTENGRAAGVMLADGATVPSAITISAADWNYTLFTALRGRYVDKKILALKEQKELEVYYSVFLLSLGVSGSFRELPRMLRFPLNRELVSPDGTTYSRMEIHCYNYDPTLAPEGKCVVNVKFYTKRGDYWIDLRKSDPEQYIRKKTAFSEEIIRILEEKFRGFSDTIEETDIATPATYHRYTNNWQGSTQGWLPGKNLIAASPVGARIPGLKDFYMAGQWTQPGGGLPVAIKSARTVAQMICHAYKKPFVISK
ncbi:MAG: NAD(P)/FAD-dependent oxidoreductase [Bacteroidetes bacterium]|nr:NAD(P)/FAD-dependent oxidoreductase [Bacteroidota bacterium]